MNLADFPLLADENIHPEAIAFLRAAGFDVLSVVEEGLNGADDLTLIRLARSQGRIVVTHDRGFSRSTFMSGQTMMGLVCLRPGDAIVAHTMDSLRWLLTQDLNLRPGFILIVEDAAEGRRLRLRFLLEE